MRISLVHLQSTTLAVLAARLDRIGRSANRMAMATWATAEFSGAQDERIEAIAASRCCRGKISLRARAVVRFARFQEPLAALFPARKMSPGRKHLQHCLNNAVPLGILLTRVSNLLSRVEREYFQAFIFRVPDRFTSFLTPKFLVVS